MNVLSVDVGLFTGWAMSLNHGRTFDSGEKNFSATSTDEDQHRSWGKFYNDFEAWLISMCISHNIELFTFELAPNAWKNLASRLSIVGSTAICYKVCDKLELNLCPLSPTAIKKFATDKGNAKKTQMIAALKRKYKITVKSSHEADAIWMIKYVEELVL